MGGYVLNSPMISIPMGGANVVLGVQWLQSLGTMDFNFQKLVMKLSWEGKEYELNGIIGKPSKVISSNGMKTLLKKQKQGVNTQLYSYMFKHVRLLFHQISKGSLKILPRYLKIFQ